MFAIRRWGYAVIDRLSEVKQVRNCTGFGLYDKSFVSVLRRLPDPYPYFRGIVAELGFRYATIPYMQPKRTRGITKNNLYMLYDLGIQGIVNHSKIPLRLATILGFCSSVLSLVAAFGLLRHEDALLVRPADWDRAPHHRPLLCGIGAAVLPRCSRRVRRLDLYAGPQSAARRRGRAHQLRRRDRGLTQGTGDSSRPAAGGPASSRATAVNRYRDRSRRPAPLLFRSWNRLDGVAQHCRRRLDSPSWPGPRTRDDHTLPAGLPLAAPAYCRRSHQRQPTCSAATAVGYLGNNFLPARAGELMRTALVSSRAGLGSGLRDRDRRCRAHRGRARARGNRRHSTARHSVVARLVGQRDQASGAAGVPRRDRHCCAAAHRPEVAATRCNERGQAHRFSCGSGTSCSKASRACAPYTRPNVSCRLLGLTAAIWTMDTVATVVIAAALGLQMPLAAAFLLIACLGLCQCASLDAWLRGDLPVCRGDRAFTVRLQPDERAGIHSRGTGRSDTS